MAIVKTRVKSVAMKDGECGISFQQLINRVAITGTLPEENSCVWITAKQARRLGAWLTRKAHEMEGV